MAQVSPKYMAFKKKRGKSKDLKGATSIHTLLMLFSYRIVKYTEVNQ